MLIRTYNFAVISNAYVGVNAPVAAEEIEAIGRLYRQRLPQTNDPRFRLIEYFLGFMVSYKSLYGRRGVNPRWAKHYPDVDAIPELMATTRNSGMRPIIHFNSKMQDGSFGLCTEMEVLEAHWGSVPDGWQLNVVWPDPHEIRRYLEAPRHAEVRFIIQISRAAFDQVGRDPKKLVARMGDYADIASYFLFDMSGGEGIPLDIEGTLPVIEAMYGRFHDRLAVAGGLGPGTVMKLAPLIERFPELSWDAQGRLRDDEDDLDLGKVDAYLAESANLLNR